MSKHQTKTAKGHVMGNRVRIAVSLTQTQFDFLKEQALKDRRSISDVIRDYVDTGILVDRDILDEQKAAS